MKRIQIAILTLLLSSSFTSAAQAEHNGVNEILIGAGSGAILGQAIGGNTEATLVGSAVGGIVGYMIGNESNHNGRVISHSRRPYRPAYNHYQTAPAYRGKPFRSRNDYRQRDKACRETVKIKKRHGKRKRIITETCWYDTPNYRHDRYNNNWDKRPRYNRRNN